MYLLLTALLLVASGIVGYFAVGIGVGMAAVGLALLALMRRLALKRRQRTLKDLLRKVPVSRQVLARYPRAVVVVPDEAADT